MRTESSDVLVVGAGIVGIATAYYLKKLDPNCSVILIDAGQPMALTSAQSGENYRNWWPHPVMSNFTDRSIDLMEQIAAATDNRINLTRRGYVLATRNSEPDELLAELEYGYSNAPTGSIRCHTQPSSRTYCHPTTCTWQNAPAGVDILSNSSLIQKTFPSYDRSVETLIHVRRAGSVDSQQLGQYMLESFTTANGIRLSGKVTHIDTHDGFDVYFGNEEFRIKSDRLVNAAGPFVNEIAGMLGTELPVTHTLQQKIAFEDKACVIPRAMPFSIDLDAQLIDWSDDERSLLLEDAVNKRYGVEMPGAIHCRPDGGDNGNWVKLGWAFNNAMATPQLSPELNEEFPEIVLRGAARLNPALKAYYGTLPRNTRHYGGFYTLTDENWPLVGPMSIDDSYVVGALSGFGTMAACASGELCAQHVLDKERPDYAFALSPQRYSDSNFMHEVRALSSRGIL
ncbi:FAD-binding oxidoreductase [Granulosicoccus sp.]|nr:FAD-dependent oxidoreductase [Granulosicoccus sp.]MDB4222164.1 FAD-binding oxidoreductase [Granulosicoccus sp.]